MLSQSYAASYLLLRPLTDSEQDPILRYGGVFTIGMAYCGTANNDAIQRLLHVAVSDVNDDVRRGAVINIGFLLSREPKQCPRMVQLLAASYNPHVRYGATMAVGIACAGTALKVRDITASDRPLANITPHCDAGSGGVAHPDGVGSRALCEPGRADCACDGADPNDCGPGAQSGRRA